MPTLPRRLLAFAASAAVSLATGGLAFADEGMWTFDNFPSAQVKAKYGVTVDQAWLDRVRGSAVRLSTGCSASVVSPNGLVLTNHHCVNDCVQDASTAQRDYIKEGFSAASREEERKCAGMQAEILQAIADVTPRVQAATAGKTGAAFGPARDAAVSAIEKEGCAGKEAVQRCQVVTLYQGGQYKLYTYRKYADVRLVFAPELTTAFFGGDPDNFNFPRYDLDSAFVRLYEGGRPVSGAQHLRWNASAPRDGEPVFVAGNPGSTQRLLTADQLRSLRDIAIPNTALRLSELRGRLLRYGEEGPEQARTAQHQVFGIENSYKVYYGELQALNQPGFLEGKARADADLRARVQADPKLRADIGDPWGEIAAVQADYAALYLPNSLLSGGAGGSDLYAYARSIVRAAQERTKPNPERLPEYTDTRLALLEKNVLDEKPVDAALEQQLIQFWLTKTRELLTADAPEVKVLLGRSSPQTLSRQLAASRLGDAAVRAQLWRGGLGAVQASTDPMIRFVLATDAQSRAVRKSWEARVTGPTERAQARIARARFAAFGDKVYPDATFSLRLSYGQVAGWTYRGRTVPSFTRFAGLYERATGEDPFALTPKWIAARTRLNPTTVFDISSSNDIIGGNSGSPLINAQGDVIGAVFDGNIHSLGGAFAYDPALNRSVTVSTAAITEALDKVYGNRALVAELTGR